MATSFSNLLAHVVFSTKHRNPWILKERQKDLHGFMGGVIQEERGILLEAGGMPDHVHLLVKLPTYVPVARLVRRIKSNSSRWMNENRYHNRRTRFAWQVGYGAFSVSQSRANDVRLYIQRQEERHARVSYRQELVTLLRRHGIEYDERYLLG
ncbi:MAG TPA: IS200/IS605 family transposase [Thermoanaerobaculia bacterium]|nr:IS200/IS605 family transposase [Thermoanaerobaculia bacterium]